MYNIYADGVLIHHSQSPDPLVKVIDPKLKRSDNAAGSLTMKIPPSNPGYETIKRLSSEIVVKRVEKSGEKELWSGRVIDESKDFWNNRSLTCEGELGYLNDTSQPPAEYHNISVKDFLGTLLDIHNVKSSLATDDYPISIKFNANTATERGWDYLYIYYADGTGTYSNIVLNGAIGERIINIPTSKFYIHWRTDGSVPDYYGYKIDSIEKYDGIAYTSPTNKGLALPNLTAENRSLYDLPESPHNPYNNNSNELYYIDAGLGKHAFTLGIVTVTDTDNTGEDSLYRYTNYESTLDCIIDKLVKRLGGHLRVRKENGVRYLDYLKDYPNSNTQTIEFGKNLIDFTRNWDMKDLATVVMPLGCNVSELGLESSIPALEEYLTVSEVNDNSPYVISDNAVKEYGWIETVVHFDDVTIPSNLLRKAKEYLEVIQFEEMVLELSAVDLHYFDIDVEAIDMLDVIHCVSTPHGMDKTFPITEIDIPLDKPDDTVFTLGDTERSTRGISASIRETNSTILSAINELPSTTSVLNKAKSEATDMLNMYTNGFINIVTDEDTEYGMHSESLIISNKQDWYDYKNVNRYDIKFWKWNVNGLAFYDYTDRSNTSKDESLALRQALTMDGTIVADRILTGQLGKKEWGNYWNMETGEFHLGLNNSYVGDSTSSSNRIATTGNVSNAVTSANNYTNNSVNNLDNSLNQLSIFNRLTNNGEVQGIARVWDSSSQSYKIYINASYINTGYISADRIYGGLISGKYGTGMSINLETGAIYTNNLTVSSSNFNLTSNGILTATGASINGSITTANGSYKIMINSGEIDVYYNDWLVGQIEGKYTKLRNTMFIRGYPGLDCVADYISMETVYRESYIEVNSSLIYLSVSGANIMANSTQQIVSLSGNYGISIDSAFGDINFYTYGGGKVYINGKEVRTKN